MDRFTKILLSVIGVLLFSSALLTVRTCHQDGTIDEKNNLINSLNDTVKIWKDKDGLSNSKTSVITTRDPKDFLTIKSQDKTIQKLQQEVKNFEKQIKKGGSVTNFVSETKVTTTNPTKIDTIVIDSTKHLVYRSEFNKDGWVFGNTVATPDSTTVNIRTKDEYTLVVGFENTGFLGLGKGTPFSLVKNKNPYSTTPELKTYQVDIRRRQTWIVPTAVALGLGIIGGIIIAK